MPDMRAAVVTSFDEPPHYRSFPVPEVTSTNEVVVEVLAVGLHPRTRSGAAGSHYSSSGTLPMIPGVDGVGRRPDGALVYFVADNDVIGTMADRAVVDVRRSIVLPPDVAVEKVAAAMNPAMSSWVALRRRVAFTPGQSVAILGATGNAGAMAVQIAKLLGAGRVIAVGRNQERLERLRDEGADVLLPLSNDVEELASTFAATEDVDVVLDYLWGEPALVVMRALLTSRRESSRSLDWVEIGSVAGPTMALPSAALRSANLRLLGSGQGSVGLHDYAAELPALVNEIAVGRINVHANAQPLADVEALWLRPDVPGERVVLIP